MKTTEISNTEDTIDSRDIIARIEELNDERQPLADAIAEADENELDSAALLDAQQALEEWDASEEGAELIALKALAAEAEGYADDWQYGAQLIRDSYFEDYARELAEDIGAINGDETWPCSCIDWVEAAAQLQGDYTSIDFAGVTYWIR